MSEFIPHIHTCEVRLCHPQTWKENCPLYGQLSETEDECESCLHFITINFDSGNPLCIVGIMRANSKESENV